MNELERNLEGNVVEAEAKTREEVIGDEYEVYLDGGHGGPSSHPDLVPARVLLGTALRPRVVGKRGKRNWTETFARLSLIYDILLSNAEVYPTNNYDTGETREEGKFSAIFSDHINLVEEFYSLFPEAKPSEHEESVETGIPKRALRPHLFLVKDSRLLGFLENLRDYFGSLVEGTRFGYNLRRDLPDLFPPSEKEGGSRRTGERVKSKNPNYVRLKEAVSLASRSLALGGNLNDEKYYEDLLRDVLEAYLSYAESFRGLPKPDLEVP